MWQSYGKGKTKAQLQAALGAASMPTTQICVECEKTMPLSNFGVIRGRRRKKCRICRSAAETAKNDHTRSSADRKGMAWTRDEMKVVAERKDLSDNNIALALSRTISSVRACRHRLGLGHKRAKAPIYNRFIWQTRFDIKVITVETSGNEITVWSPKGVIWVNIHKAFLKAGLSAQDYQDWKLGVTSGG